MNKLLIAILCGAALTLTACNKNPTEQAGQAATAVKLSTDNIADIKTDLTTLETLSASKAKEALDFQTKATQASQSGDINAAKAVIDDMQKSFAQYDKDLDALALKSTEVDSLRKNTKKVMSLTVEFMQQSIAEKPDLQKITDLQKQMVDAQKALLDEQIAIKQKISKS